MAAAAQSLDVELLDYLIGERRRFSRIRLGLGLLQA
jgi:hypothetical protein